VITNSIFQDTLSEGICSDCGRYVRAVVIDNGIGPYEFWGQRGVHHDYVQASPCCHADVVEGGEKIIRRSIHTARKDHGSIKTGDRYRLTVFRTWRKDGPSWVHVRKDKL
jgi:hypothetical protein